MSLVSSIAEALGFSNEYEEDEVIDEREEEEERQADIRPRHSEVAAEKSRPRATVDRRSVSYDTYRGQDYERTGRKATKVVNLQANVQMEVVVASPESLREAKDLARSIRDNKPVVVNLEFVEHATAQRITDFLCGCCFALNGRTQRIADKIFMIAPDNVDFAGDIDFRETLTADGGLNFSWSDEK